MDQLLKILMIPGAQAVVIKFVTDFLKDKLKDMDNAHIMDNYSKYVSLIVTVLTGLATFLTQAAQHQASTVDVGSIVSYFVNLFLTTVVVHKTLEGAKAAGNIPKAVKLHLETQARERVTRNVD